VCGIFFLQLKKTRAEKYSHNHLEPLERLEFFKNVASVDSIEPEILVQFLLQKNFHSVRFAVAIGPGGLPEGKLIGFL